MRDPNRIDPFLHELGVLWKLFPDMRFGQLVENIPSLAGTGSDSDGNWNREEGKWLEMILRAQIVGNGLETATEEYLATQADTGERYGADEASTE